MLARMRSVWGWFHRQGKVSTASSRARRRTGLVPSAFDSLERRQVLSTATLTPVVIPQGLVTTVPTTSVVPVTPQTTTSTSPYLAYVYPQAAISPTVVAASTPIVVPSTPIAVTPTPITLTTPSYAASAMAPVFNQGQAAVPGTFTGLSVTDPDSAYVQSLYHDLLGRSGAANEVASWVGQMNSGLSLAGVAQGINNSVEHRQDEVASFYEQFLKRAPDPGSAYFVNAMEGGASEQAVVEALLDSPEYQAEHQDPDLFVRDLYIDVLGRQGNASELAYWESGMAQGLSRLTVVDDFVKSAEAVDQAVDSLYSAFLGRPAGTVNSALYAEDLEAPGGSVSGVTVAILSSREFAQGTVPA